MDYTKIAEFIAGIDMSEEGAGIIKEAADIIYDYEKAATQAAALIAKYETPRHVIRRGYGGIGAWQCPDCQVFVDRDAEHCKHCGCRLEWTIKSNRKSRKTAGKNTKRKKR